MKILLFGGTGLFGTEFEAICNTHQVNLIAPTHKDVDIANHTRTASIIEEVRPTIVINAVAIVGIDKCEERPGQAYAVNAAAAYAIARQCADQNITMVQTSTHAVFDGTKNFPYTEEDQPRPISIYSLSKYAGECFVRDICPKHYVLRFPTMYGSRRNFAPGFVDKMIEKLQAGCEVRVADDKYDSPSYAQDTAKITLDILKNELKFGTYHIANEGNISLYQFVQKLADTVGAKGLIHPAKDQDFPSKGHKPLRTAIKSSLLPKNRDWKEALESFVKNTRNHD